MSVGHSSDSHCIGFSEPPGVFLDYNNSMLGEGTKKALFRSLLLRRGPDPPPFVVPWESETLGPYFNVVVDAISPETDSVLKTNRKKE